MQRTLGISPKAILAFCFPAIASVGGAVTTWIVTGDLDTEALRVAGGGRVGSVLALLGAYLGAPGQTTVKPPKLLPHIATTATATPAYYYVSPGPGNEPDDDDDGDDELPAELEHATDTPPAVPDEIDQPDGTVK